VNWRHSAAALALTVAACGTAPSPRPAAGQTADLVIVNGRVFTADERGTTAQAVATAGNKILLVGTNDAVSALRGPQTRVVDARGRPQLAADLGDERVALERRVLVEGREPAQRGRVGRAGEADGDARGPGLDVEALGPQEGAMVAEDRHDWHDPTCQ